MDWNHESITTSVLWLIDVQEHRLVFYQRFVDVDSQMVFLDDLKSKDEVLAYFYENGPTHSALMDFCEDYRERYHNELCWNYPISDGRHLGAFFLLVKEGVLSLPYDDADKVDYELFCLDDVRFCDKESLSVFIEDWDSFARDLRSALWSMLDFTAERRITMKKLTGTSIWWPICLAMSAGKRRMDFFRIPATHTPTVWSNTGIWISRWSCFSQLARLRVSSIPWGCVYRMENIFRQATMFPASMKTAKYGWMRLRRPEELCCEWSSRISTAYSQRTKTAWKHISCSNYLRRRSTGKAVRSHENENLSDHSGKGHTSYKIQGNRGHAAAL